MHRALPTRWLNKALRIGDALPTSGVPVFLCPAIQHGSQLASALHSRCSIRVEPRRILHTEAACISVKAETPELTRAECRYLPLTCSGCGAFAQTNDANQLGYYDVTAKRVRNWRQTQEKEPSNQASEEEDIINDVMKSMDSSKLEELGISAESMVATGDAALTRSGKASLDLPRR